MMLSCHSSYKRAPICDDVAAVIFSMLRQVLTEHLKSCTNFHAGLINAQTLLNKAAETAADLELELPPLNAALVIERTLVELAMPQV